MTVFVQPTKDDLEQLARQSLIADRYVQEHCDGSRLDQSESDLELLQRVIDAGVLSATRSFELQCLGVALGRVLVSNLEGLEWSIVDDEYGRDPAIRYRDTTLQLNVLTMISKRIERGEAVDVRELYRRSRASVAELGGKVD